MAEPIKSKFSDWNRSKLQRVFGLERIYNNKNLKKWIHDASLLPLNDLETKTLTYIQKHAQLGIEEWSEEEIKMEVIHPILALIHFTVFDEETDTIAAKAFSGRSIKGVIGKYEIHGEPDGIIAAGNITPQLPYFCLQEYKKQQDNKDGLGQLLAAMLIAQELNTKKRPIYGAYVLGQNWYFVLLEGVKYGVSKVYLATEEDIFNIYRILQQLKLYVIQFLEEDKDLP